MFYVYAYLRTKDLTPYYIGKGKDDRAWQKSHSVIVPKDLNRIVILESNLSELGAFAIERRMIRWYGRKDLGTGILYNRTDGGDGAAGIIPWNKDVQIGSFLTDAGRKKISKANKGIKKEHGDKISAALKGKPKSETHRKNLSKAGKGKTPWNKGLTKDTSHAIQQQSNMLKGRCFTDEHRAKLSEAHKGRANTEEQKAKISAKLKGRVMSEETKRKMSEARKKLWEEKKNGKR
jgi:transposase InsO family protein